MYQASEWSRCSGPAWVSARIRGRALGTSDDLQPQAIASTSISQADDVWSKAVADPTLERCREHKRELLSRA